MSRYEWERGELLIPTAAWPKLKADLRETYNRLQSRKYALALALYTELERLANGKTHFDARNEFPGLYERQTEGTWGHRAPFDELGGAMEAHEEIVLSLFGSFVDFYRLQCCSKEGLPVPETVGGRRRPLKPKLQDFPLLTGASKLIQLPDATIAFDEPKHTVFWEVQENNHALERAYAHPVVQEFMRLLTNLNWTRGSGGVFVGNDEYNRETEHPGGGGNYVTKAFGPRGAALDPAKQPIKRLTRKRK